MRRIPSNRLARLIAVMVAAVAFAGCQQLPEFLGSEGMSDPGDDEPANEAPSASTGADRSVTIGSTVDLDAGDSSDPDEDSLVFAWAFLGVPDDSDLSDEDIADASSATPSFKPDVVGDYELEVTVDDGTSTDTSTVVIMVEPPPASTYDEPAGDTFGSGDVRHDITEIRVRDGSVVFRVAFDGQILPNTSENMEKQRVVTGYIEIDADQNPETGLTPIYNEFAEGQVDLGIEYRIDLWTVEEGESGLVVTVAPTGEAQGTEVPISFEESAFEVSVPLSALGSDDGDFDFNLILGTTAEPTDVAGPFTYEGGE